MRDIRKIIELYCEKPTSHILVNRLNGNLIALTEAQDAKRYTVSCEDVKNPDLKEAMKNWAQYVELPIPDEGYLAEIRKDFLEQYDKEELFDRSKGFRSYTRFNAFVKEKGLWEAWIDFYETREYGDIVSLLFADGFIDDEASDEDYQRVRAALEEYESYHFEKKFNDGVLFSCAKAGCFTRFTILGNGGDTFGLSFYFGPQPEDIYYTIREVADDSQLATLPMMLAPVISFYFEKNKFEAFSYGRYKNKYGEDHHITSIMATNGHTFECYLGKYMARLMCELIPEAVRVIKTLEKKHPEFNDDTFGDVLSLYHGHPEVQDVKVMPLAEEYHFFCCEQMCMFAMPLWTKKPKAKLEMDFALRIFPAPIQDESGDPRINYRSIVLLLCDPRSGYCYRPILASSSDGVNIFQDLVEKVESYFAESDIPSKVYVDNLQDHFFADMLFQTLVDQNRLKISYINGQTVCADAFEHLCDAMDEPGPLPEA